MASTIVQKVQTIIGEFNPSLLTKVGSNIYYYVVLPATTVYSFIQEQIDAFAGENSIQTATDKDALASNFGLTRKEGKKAFGELTITVSNDRTIYSFPAGTIFNNASGEDVVTTEERIIDSTQQTVFAVPVETVNVGNIFYDLEEVFTSSIYGDQVTSAVVTTQIANGSDQETDDELLARIQSRLTQSSVTVTGIRSLLTEQFPNIVDVIIRDDRLTVLNNVSRPSGIRVDIIFKSAVTTKSQIISPNSQGEYVLFDQVFDIVTEGITVTDKANPNTIFERNVLSIPGATGNVNVEYTSSTNFQEIQNFLDDEAVFPLGVNYLAVSAPLVKVTGNIDLRNNSTDYSAVVEAYINSKGFEQFSIADFLTDNNITNAVMPVSLNFNGVPEQDIFEDKYVSYVYDGITFTNIL